MSDSFWRNAARSLPPQVRWRHVKLFEAAERFDALLDFVAASGSRARGPLARSCLGMADALRKAARALDVAARRLLLTR